MLGKQRCLPGEGTFGTPKPLYICMGTLRSLAALLVGVLLLSACSGDDSPADTPTPDTAATPSPTATLTERDEPTAEPTPDIVAGRKHVYARGETVHVARGMLFLDAATGGGVVWEGASASPSGMYVFWQDPQGQAHVVHTVTEAELVIGRPGEFPSVVGFSPDDGQFAAWTEDAVTIYATRDGSEVVRFQLEPGTGGVGVRWSEQGWIAVIMTGVDRAALGVRAWRDGQQHFISPGGNGGVWVEWSPDGEWLAVSKTAEAESLVLHNLRTGDRIATGGHGTNPRWSASGKFLALQAPLAELGAWPLRVFRLDGAEILRVYGICASLGSRWQGDALFAPWTGTLVALDGTVTEDPDFEFGPAGRYSTFTAAGGVELIEDGQVLAELHVPSGATWLSSSEDIHTVTTDGRGMFVLPGAGKGFCGHEGKFGVELPPFD